MGARTPRLAGLVAATLLLAGCGGSPEPQPLPKPTASTSPSATSSPPVVPETASENTRSGAIAFVRHYVDLINFAQSTGEVAAMQRVESRGCESCQSVENDLNDLYSSGGSLAGGAWRIDRVLDVTRTTSVNRVVGMVVKFGPQVIRRPRPDASERLQGGTLPLTIKLRFDEGSWEVDQWTRGR